MNSRKDKLSETQAARADLYETFAQLSDRLNYAKRFDEAVEYRTAQLKKVKQNNPATFAVAVIGVAGAAGAVTWVIASKIFQRFC